MDADLSRVVATVTEREDGRWYCCPIGGQDCYRVSAVLSDWASDAVAWHVSNHHKRWR